MLKLKKINDEVVKPIPIKKVKKRDVIGYKLFCEPYCNIFLCAKKKSGKTCVINKILKSCTGKETKIFIFSSTALKDPNMRRIIKDLNKKGIDNEVYTEIGQNLALILQELQFEENYDGNSDSESEEALVKHNLIEFNDTDDIIRIKIKKKPKAQRLIAPRYIFIFDDISSDLKSPDISKLTKQNRHYLCKVIISSQYPFDLKPESRKQQDYFLLFGGQPEDKLVKLYENFDLNIPFEIFLDMYHQATSQKYNFLYIDTNEPAYRINFDQKFLI